jgi:hypothetical protein
MEKPLESQSLTQTESQIRRQIVIEGYTDPVSQRKYEITATQHYKHENYVEKIEIVTTNDVEGKELILYPVYCENKLCGVDVYVKKLVYGEKWIVLEDRINVTRNSLPYFFTLKALENMLRIYGLPRVLKDILGFLNQAFNTELRL